MSAPIGYQLDLFGGRDQSVPTHPVAAVLDGGAACHVCGALDIYTRRVGAHVGAYCSGCGCWITWLNKSERARVRAQGGDA